MDPSDAIAHLYRRAGFGATSPQVAAASADGYLAAVDRLIAGLAAPDPVAGAVGLPDLSGPPADYREDGTVARRALERELSAQYRALYSWWLTRMVVTTSPLQEKLTFLLHGLFPTAVSKVRFPLYMYDQNELFRTLGPGDFTDLTQAVATGAAMLIWLDAGSDKASNPNENFARELMERFTMGIGTYTEADVRAAAYCFTGWQIGRAGEFFVNARDHSTAQQKFLGTSGVTTGEEVIELVTHSEASERYVPAAFWSHLAYPVAPDDPVVTDLSRGYAADRNITSLLRSIFEHPEFTSTAAATGLIKQPTEYLVGALRAFGLGASEVSRAGAALKSAMADMGQLLFDPPSVGGWGQNEYWLSTSAALARWRFAHRLCHSVDLSPISDVRSTGRIEAAAEFLSVPSWSDATYAALRQAPDPATLMTLAMSSPEYTAN